MGVYKNSKGLWGVDYWCNGKRIREIISTRKRDAEDYLANAKNDIRMKRHPLPKDENVSFVDFAKKYAKLHSSQKKSFESDKSLLKQLVAYFGGEPLSKVAENAKSLVPEYKAERLNARVRKGYKHPNGVPISPTTINRELALLRNMLNKAVEWNDITTNPLVGAKIMFKEEPKERILTDDEMETLLNMAGENLRNQIIIALNTGMRKGEILNLKWSSVYLKERYLETRSKTTVIRMIPLNDAVLELLSRLSLVKNGNEFVFTNPKTGMPYIDNKAAWYGLLRRTGIKDFRFHDLRHCFATYTLLNGGDLISLKDTLGHTDIRTTSRYSKAMLEGKKRLVNGFQIGGEKGRIIEMLKENIKAG